LEFVSTPFQSITQTKPTMKALSIGIKAFILWAAPSTYYYVCKIQGFCAEEETAIVKVEPEIKGPEETPIDTVIGEEVVHLPVPETFTLYHDFDVVIFLDDPGYNGFCNELKSFLDNDPNANVLINGYTDSKGSNEYNYGLGEKRAKYVETDLKNKGLPPTLLRTNSMGESSPVSDNSTEEGRAKNRRTTITIQANN